MNTKTLIYFWNFLKRPDIIAPTLMETNPFAGKSMLRAYVLPWCAVITAATFVSYIFFTRDFRLETAVIKSLFEFLTFLSSYFAAVAVCKVSNRLIFRREIDKYKCEVIIAYGFLLLYALRIVMCILPHMFFLKVLLLYIFYILWILAEQILKYKDSEKQYFMLVNGASIIVFPYLIEKILFLLTPNIGL